MTNRWILAAVLLAGACSGAGDEDGKAADPVALVTLGRAEQGALAEQVTLYGAAEAGPAGKLSVSAPAEATVAAIDAPVGTPVARGQIIARLSASPTTRVDLAKTASEAQAADAALARAERLRADGLVSNADVETARAAARSADVTRASIAGRAGALTLRAPETGVVDSVAPSPGDLVQPGAVVATIVRQSGLRARFGADPAAASSLRPGMPLRIAANAGRAAFTVPIESIGPVADPQTRLSSVFVRLPAGSGIGAGQTLAASVTAGTGGDGVTIPYAALLDDGGQAYVFVVAGGVAHRRDVATGPAGGDRVTVTSGVKPGERVVVEGGTAIEDGMKVRTR